jgi:hypothetical protein
MRIGLTVIVLLVSLLAAPRRSESTTTEQALARAVEFLWSKQADDGAWRSERYGVMRSGESLTPFVLSGLMRSIGSLSSDEAGRVRLAARFILDHLDDEGAIGRSDPDVFEYPVYSTAFAVESLLRVASYEKAWGGGPAEDFRQAARRMQRFLATAQYREVNGFQETDVAYGGWGFNAPVQSGVVGHMDLAHTRKALASLATWNEPSQLQQLRNRAEQFLLLMQKHPDAAVPQPHPIEIPDGKQRSTFDGGFYFSPIALSANKAPYDEETCSWPSYATATCDGILSLLAAGVGEDDPRLAAAVNWLQEHDNVDYPEGVPTDHPEPWGDAVRFYHYAVRAEVYRRLEFPIADQTRLAAAVVARQQPDGSFVNTMSPLMKEDDPVLCTTLAVMALQQLVHDVPRR